MRLKQVASVLLLLCCLTEVRASWILGGNVAWDCLGGNQYTITLTLYKDCLGATPDLPTASIYLEPSGCALTPFTTDLTLASSSEVSQLCPTELPNSSCNGGFLPGTTELTYTGTVTLDPGCSWNVFYNAADWNYFNNINYTSFPDSYISGTINPAFGCNDSPLITSDQVNYECANTGNVTNTLTMTGTAGYTLAYSLITPQTIPNELDPFTNGNVPGYNNNGATVNAATGELTLNTNGLAIGNYVFTVQITITSGGNVIGTMFQNTTIIIRDCSTTPTTFDVPEVQTLESPAILVSPTEIDVCVGDSVCFTVQASNTNQFRTVLLSADIPPALNPGNPVFNVLTAGNPSIGEFCMATTTPMVGTHIIHFEATDDACVLPGFDQIDITVNIYPSVSLTVQDTMICAGEDVVTVASGGVSYTWTVLSGDGTPGFDGNGGTQTLEAISEDTEIEVLLNGVPAQCDARDTLTVLVSLSDLDLVVTDESCSQNDGAINLTVTGGTGNYTYAWDNNAVTEDISSLDGGNYCVDVTDNGVPGCTVQACAVVNSTPPPGGTISLQGGGNAVTICEGLSATLAFDGTGAAGEPYVLTVTGAGANTPASINDLGTWVVNPPVGVTTYTLTNVAYQNFPACNVPVNSTVTVTVRPVINGVFLPAGPVCAGSTLGLTFDASTTQGAAVAGNMNVTFTANPVDPPGAPNADALPWTDGQVIDFNPNVTTTYTVTNVEYTNAPTCPNPQNNPITVTVNPLPTATLTGTASICAGANTNLTLTLTGTGPWSVEYTVNGGAVQTMAVPANPSPYAYIWNVNPAATTTYCITEVTDGNNCTAAIAGQCVTVTVTTAPSVTMSGTSTVCAGTATNLNFVYNNAPGTEYDMIITPSNGPVINLDNFNALSYVVSPATSTTYTLTTVSYNGQCAVNPGDQVIITIQTAPITINQSTLCDPTGESYTVSFDIVGTAPFTVNGVASGASYTSPAIADNTASSFIVDDATVCPTLTVNIAALDCPTITESGTMSQTTLEICGPNTATGVFNNDAVLDPNDQQAFILQTLPGPTVGTVIATDCNSPDFVDADTPLLFGANIFYGVTYYICSVVGNDSGNGDCVNLNHPNTQVSVGQPVIWYQTATANVAGGGSACQGQSVPVTIDFTGTGPWTFTYELNNVAQPPAITTNSDPYTLNINVSGTIDLPSVTTGPGCLGNASGSANVIINPLPTATLSGDVAMCTGVGTSLTVTTTGTGPWTIAYTVDGVASPVNLVIPAGGSPFTWNLNPAQTTTYCLTSVTDATTCSSAVANECATITVNPAPGATFNGNGSICQGSNYNFTINFTGASPWTYIVNAGGVDQAASNSALASATYTTGTAGNYYITSVTDGNGCQTTTDSPTVTLTVNPLPTATIAANGVICAGETFDFTVNFTGTAPITDYDIDGPGANDQLNQTSAALSDTFTASAAGNYVISSVTDNNGCVSSAASAPASLTVNPLPTAALSASAAICDGQTHNFTIALTGTGPFDIEIYESGIPYTTLAGVAGPNATFTTGDAGSYTIFSVTDANCTNDAQSAASVLTVYELPTVSWLSPDTAFCAGSSVDVEFELTGPAQWDVEWTLDGAAQPDILNIGSSPHSLNLSQDGSYCLTQVTDNNGCVATVNECIVITEVQVPVADAGADLETCSEVPIVIGTPAQPGVVYTWEDPSGILDDAAIAQPAATSSNAGPADVVYVLSLTAEISAAGLTCSTTDDMELTVHALPVITITAADDSVCFGATTALTAAGAGAGGSYEWLADLPTILDPITQAVVDVQPVGTMTYEVEGTDANGCISTATIDIIAGEPLVVDEVFTPYQCFGICEGTIDLTPSGGFDPYTIAWAVPVNDPDSFSQTDLCAGTYAYTVTDEQGCNTALDNLQILIDGLDQNFIDDVIITDASCSYDSDGQIEIVEPGALEYVIYNCAELTYDTLTTNVFTGIAPCDFIDIYVTDAFGCQLDSLNLVLSSQSLPIELTVNPFDDVFCYNQIASFTGDAQGGFGNLELQWYNCPDTVGCQIGDGTPFDLAILQDTTLWAVVVDELGCRSDTASVSAELASEIALLVQEGIDEVEICQGECVDMFAEVSGGTGDLTVQWFELPDDINGEPIGPDGLAQTVCPLFPTGYFAYASDGCSAPAYDTLNVIVYTTPEVIFSVDTLSGCYPVTVTFTNETDPALTDQCVWNFGDETTLAVCGEVSYTYASNGEFFPSLTVTTPDGCTSADTLDVPIEVFGYPEIDFIWTPDPVNVLETTVEFLNLTEGATEYHWSFATFAESEQENPVFTFPDIDLAVYDVCLEATNEFGCIDTLCRPIVIQSILQVWVPNAFTPDQDDVNEVFLPVIRGYNPDKYHLYIYDRWGTMVFETTNPLQAWTGNVQDGEYYSQSDTFVWRIEVERLSDGTFEVFEGIVTLVR